MFKVEITKLVDVNTTEVIDRTIDRMIDMLADDLEIDFDDISTKSREAFVDALVEEFKIQMQYLK